jgi:membrane-bound ClpP family serine protease
MARPDLGTREGRRVYRSELAGVARGWRYAGLGLVALGLVLLVAARMSGAAILHSAIGLGAIAALVIGWALATTGIVKRTRYHRGRMAD